jgi:hypothetical protein
VKVYKLIFCFFNSINKGQNCVSGKSCGVFDCLIESEDSFLLSIRRDAALNSMDRRSKIGFQEKAAGCLIV